jgi:transposase
MELDKEQVGKLEKFLPKPRKKPETHMINFLNAILYITENGYKWRALPEKFGDWHVIHVRMNRWSKN